MNRLSPRLGTALAAAAAIVALGAGGLAFKTAHQPSGWAANASAADVEQRFKQGTDAFEAAFNGFEKEAAPGREFAYDLSPLANELQAVMREGRDPGARQAAAVRLPMLSDYLVTLPRSAFEAVVRTTPPLSATWTAGARSIGYEARGLEPNRAREFLNAMAVGNPDRTVQGEALIALAKLELREGRLGAYEAVYRRLAPYKAIDDLSFRIAVLNPANKVRVGKRAPIFELPVIGESGARFSNRALAGRYYLIDFWATWCGPCLAERGALERVRRRYPEARLAIVSVSMDKSPADVTAFRARRWRMPWTHVFLEGGQDGAVAKAFDVNWIGLPRPVLVDPRGMVVATQDELGRDTMAATLEQFLGR
jgi:thiol-disulfide isomerase/thioredoxin